MTQRIAYAQVAPDGIKALRGVRTYLETTAIGPRLRALVELRVSQINGCSYCIDLHSQEARRAGEGQQRLDALPAWRETPFFDDRERAALAWAESLTLVAQTRAADPDYDAARAHFAEKDLVDLTLIVAMMNAWNRIAVGFRQGPTPRREG